jgi:lysozyme
MITCLEDQLKRDEGCSQTVYTDTMGNKTIGVGHEIQQGEHFTFLTMPEIESLLQKDITHAKAELAQHLLWTSTLPDVYHGVLINLYFNMGYKLLEFYNTLSLIHAGRYSEAADELLRSKWATEVGLRAHRLYEQLKTGTWQ